MKKKYEAFTLIEMIVVMGVLAILIAIGISVARYAILKSQDAQHMDAARNLYSLMLKYKNDHKEYPCIGTGTGCIEEEIFARALGYNGTDEEHVLEGYEDDGKFDGGANATYYYDVDEYDSQFIIVCVSLGGVDDEMERGFYCTGDGIGSLPEENPIPDKNIGSEESGDPYAIVVKSLDNSDWHKVDGFALGL